MKKIINTSVLAVSVSLVFFSCKPEIDLPVATKGNIDVSKYVAIGNSMSAGYSDNALYHNAQLMAYPNLMAQQFSQISGGAFKQPMVNAGSVGIGSYLNSQLILAPSVDCQGIISLAPKYLADKGDLTIFGASVAAQGPFNNMSVPGLKSVTAIYPGYGNPANGTGNFNPYFTRMAADPATASILSEAAGQAPTFFSLSVGNDDVLAYAISGGTSDAITPSAGPAGMGFDASVDVIINTLTANGAKGAIANVPGLTSIPYFTTVPFNGLLLDQANADALTAAYSPLGITFQPGKNGFIIEDANAPGGMRKSVDGEMILLSVPQDSLKCNGWGSMKPIPNQYVLTANEVTEISNAITSYNSKLQAIAIEKGLAYVDVSAFMNKVKTGIVYNGVSLKTEFVTGGTFSLDGVNLTPIGNALLANEFIKAINSTYGSTIPQLNATKYKGISFP